MSRDIEFPASVSAALAWMVYATWVVQVRGPVVGEFVDDLRGRVVVVTGSNCGIGAEIAKELAKKGGTVIMACRSMGGAEVVRREIVRESGNDDVVVVELDLGSFESVRGFAKKIAEDYPRVDILINNAGVMMTETVKTKDAVETMMQVNFLSPILLILLLWPKLKLSTLPSGPRIINVTSSTVRLHKKFDFEDLNSEKYFNLFWTYGRTKFGLNAASFELAQLLKGQAQINVVHPGAIVTNITRNMHWFFRIGQSVTLKYYIKTPILGAQSILYLCSGLETKSGLYFEHSAPSNIPLGDRAMNQKVLRRAEEIIGVAAKDCLI